MSACQVVGCLEHYGCQLRAKGLQVAAKIHANQRSTPQPFRNAVSDSFSSAPARDDRGIPLVRPNRTPVSLGEYIPNRTTLKRQDQQGLPLATTTKD